MILKDLLFQVDRKKLIDTLYEQYFSSGHLHSLKEDVEERFNNLFDDLKKIQPTEVGIGNILIAYKFQYDYDKKVSIETSLYQIKDILNKFKVIKEFEDFKTYDVDVIDDDRVKEYLDIAYEKDSAIESYSYIADDISNILGYIVDEISFNELGLYECLANTLFELTYFGCDLVTRDKNIDALGNSEEDIDDNEDNETEDEKFDNIQFSTESLGYQLDDNEDEKTQDEENRINLFDLLSRYNALLKVYNKLKEEK